MIKLFIHVELELVHAMLVASWGISDGRLDIEGFFFLGIETCSV